MSGPNNEKKKCSGRQVLPPVVGKGSNKAAILMSDKDDISHLYTMVKTNVFQAYYDYFIRY